MDRGTRPRRGGRVPLWLRSGGSSGQAVRSGQKGHRVATVEDAAIVALLVQRDRAGFAAVYEAYADRLFAYSLSLLHDRDLAADAVHDTFIVATERIGQLRDPDRLRPWLYAIVRNECLRAARMRRRHTALDEMGGGEPMTDETADPGVDLRQEELRRLVWSAADGLNPREREVLELAVRHELDGADLGSAMGVPANHAHALLSRARQQLERALAALIVARTGRRDCAALDALLSDWDGRMSVLIRKRVARHIDRCAVCGERKRRDVSATALLGATPLLAAPAGLRERILGRLGDVQLVGQHSAIATRAGRFAPDGFPIPLDRSRTVGWQSPAVAAAAAVALLVSGVFLQGDAADTEQPTRPPVTNPQAAPPQSPESGLDGSPEPSQAPSPPSTEPPGRPTSLTGTPAQTEESPPSTSPSTTPGSSEPPPQDQLQVYCDDRQRAECELLDLANMNGPVALATTSVEPLTVVIDVPADAPWLLVDPPIPVTVAPGQLVPVYFVLERRTPCSWPVFVTFTVTESGHAESLEVTGPPACLT